MNIKYVMTISIWPYSTHTHWGDKNLGKYVRKYRVYDCLRTYFELIDPVIDEEWSFEIFSIDVNNYVRGLQCL